MSIFVVQRDPAGLERKFLERHAPQPGGYILDIGCGDGRLTRFYARHATFVAGMDVQIEKLREAEHIRFEDVEARAGFMVAEGEAMPFPDRVFNLAILSWSL